MQINHLGYATKNLDESMKAFLRMGYTKVHEDIKHHIPKNLHVLRVKLNGLIVELLSTADITKPSFVSDIFETTTEPFVLHHVCYDVDDIHKIVKNLMATGDYTVYEPITSGVFQKNQICFLRHKQIGLVEFFEWPKE